MTNPTKQKKDYGKWHQTNWCAVCGRKIAVDAVFWSLGKIYWHADCVPPQNPDASLDWREVHG